MTLGLPDPEKAPKVSEQAFGKKFGRRGYRLSIAILLPLVALGRRLWSTTIIAGDVDKIGSVFGGRRAEAPLSPIPRSTTENDKVIVDLTPETLMAFYKGRTGTEAARVVAPYIGKWIRISGHVDDLISQPPETLLVDMIDQGEAAFLHFDQPWADILAILQRNQPFVALCQIASVDFSGSDFRHCELEPR